jgi:hypothetical protein
MGPHLNEDGGAVLDVFAQQFDREILCFKQEGVATFGALRADSRPQLLRAIHLALRRMRLRDCFLLRQLLTHGVAQGEVA